MIPGSGTASGAGVAVSFTTVSRRRRVTETVQPAIGSPVVRQATHPVATESALEATSGSPSRSNAASTNPGVAPSGSRLSTGTGATPTGAAGPSGTPPCTDSRPIGGVPSAGRTADSPGPSSA